MNDEIKIILASTSPIRRQMLAQAGIAFNVETPVCDEDEVKKQFKNMELSKLALELAKAKALSVSAENKNYYVIGSDQICEFQDRAISKARSRQDAFDCLKEFSGKTHIQNNGTCIYYNSKCVMEFTDNAVLTMKKLSDVEIWDYINKDNPIGCAGSYKYELNGKELFSKVKGSAECIQGFGLSSVMEFFSRNG